MELSSQSAANVDRNSCVHLANWCRLLRERCHEHAEWDAVLSDHSDTLREKSRRAVRQSDAIRRNAPPPAVAPCVPTRRAEAGSDSK